MAGKTKEEEEGRAEEIAGKRKEEEEGRAGERKEEGRAGERKDRVREREQEEEGEGDCNDDLHHIICCTHTCNNTHTTPLPSFITHYSYYSLPFY